ncbi:DUF6711 family protein [Enterococcus sp. DIV1420a]|uniref:DUF6711 family protein n=1 Tax=Enterococcus sp. DIV1420a TaxID=2774672 RepID=UPI003F1FE818
MSGILKINGISVRYPKEFAVGLQTIDADSSGRNANGEMVRDVIAEKTKLTMKWGPLSDSEVSSLLQSVKSSFFQVEYPDPVIGRQRIKVFYVGDRTAPSYSWNSKFEELKWEGLSMDFIEQ